MAVAVNLGLADLSSPNDIAGLVPSSDLARAAADLSIGRDLSIIPDLTMASSDLSSVDLSIREDLSVRWDLALAPELSDMAVTLDLQTEDLAMSMDFSARTDLSFGPNRDLSPGPDLSTPKATLAFGQPQNFQGPGAIDGRGIDSADFNHDGFADIAVSLWGVNYTGAINIYLGKGDGMFQTPSSFFAGGGPFNVLATDLDNDGNTDVVSSAAALSIAFGNGDGTWRAPLASYSGNIMLDACALDLNGDGKRDIITAIADTGNVGVFLNSGHGILSSIKTYPIGASVSAIAGGRFTADGRLGVAVADYGTQANGSDSQVALILANADGTLSNATSYRSHDGVTDVATADFNGDGISDVVVAETSGGVGVYLGKGDGALISEMYLGGDYPNAVATGDFNADGRIDIATASERQRSFSIRLGIGDGTFGSPTLFSVGTYPLALVTADFNGDGLPDLASANDGSYLTVLLNQSH